MKFSFVLILLSIFLHTLSSSLFAQTEVPKEEKFPLEKEEAPSVTLPQTAQKTSSTQDYLYSETIPQPLNLPEICKLVGYPNLAKAFDIQGTVVVRVLVNSVGNYERHKIIKSPHPILTKRVEKYISQLRAIPGIQNGKPISFWIDIPFIFSFNEKEKKRKKQRKR